MLFLGDDRSNVRISLDTSLTTRASLDPNSSSLWDSWLSVGLNIPNPRRFNKRKRLRNPIKNSWFLPIILLTPASLTITFLHNFLQTLLRMTQNRRSSLPRPPSGNTTCPKSPFFSLNTTGTSTKLVMSNNGFGCPSALLMSKNGFGCPSTFGPIKFEMSRPIQVHQPSHKFGPTLHLV